MPREALGEFELRVLLAALRLDPDGYSVPIALEIEERSGKTVAGAAVHIALRRLEKRGFVLSRLEPRGDGEKGRPRRHYRVTEKGLVIMGVLFTLTGCETMKGVGKDIQKAGEALEKSAE